MSRLNFNEWLPVNIGRRNNKGSPRQKLSQRIEELGKKAKVETDEDDKNKKTERFGLII